MVPPFEISVFADPAGSFTTAAAMVALAKKALREKFSTTLKGKRIAVFGGTGVVAFASAVIAAVDSASSVLIGYDGPERVKKLADEARARFGVDISYADFKLQTPLNMEPSMKGSENVIARIEGAGSRKLDDYVDTAVIDGLKRDGFFAAMEQKYGKR